MPSSTASAANANVTLSSIITGVVSIASPPIAFITTATLTNTLADQVQQHHLQASCAIVRLLFTALVFSFTLDSLLYRKRSKEMVFQFMNCHCFALGLTLPIQYRLYQMSHQF